MLQHRDILFRMEPNRLQRQTKRAIVRQWLNAQRIAENIVHIHVFYTVSLSASKKKKKDKECDLRKSATRLFDGYAKAGPLARKIARIR